MTEQTDHTPDGTNELCQRCTLFKGITVTEEILEVIRAVTTDLENATLETRTNLAAAMQKALMKTKIERTENGEPK